MLSEKSIKIGFNRTWSHLNHDETWDVGVKELSLPRGFTESPT